ncbi:hypothetical protein BH11VER1_BH11VER1_09700 [soil metagenome]
MAISLLACVAVSADHPSFDLKQAAKAHEEAQKTGLCEVHKIKMNSEAVPIRWGNAVRPGPDEATYEYLMQHFPNYVEIIEGGCVKMPGVNSRMTLICSRCKDEAKAWKKSKKAGGG